MMRLSQPEFNAMSSSFRRFLQRNIEFPVFKRMGLPVQGANVLEIGCGSGYGAWLLASLKPRSYIGIDVMPEQIALAKRLKLPNAEFRLGDATQLSDFADASKDIVVIFGVLHHIPEWRQAVRQCARVLRPGGRLYVEEPDGTFVLAWERLFHWGHPAKVLLLRQLEAELHHAGFTILHRSYLFGFGVYTAQKN